MILPFPDITTQKSGHSYQAKIITPGLASEESDSLPRWLAEGRDSRGLPLLYNPGQGRGNSYLRSFDPLRSGERTHPFTPRLSPDGSQGTGTVTPLEHVKVLIVTPPFGRLPRDVRQFAFPSLIRSLCLNESGTGTKPRRVLAS